MFDPFFHIKTAPGGIWVICRPDSLAKALLATNPRIRARICFFIVFFLRSTIEGLREIASSDVQDRNLGRLERFLGLINPR